MKINLNAKILFAISYILFFNTQANSLLDSKTAAKKVVDGVITYKDTTFTVYKTNDQTGAGYLNDGTPVHITCITKGLIGMPNISMPEYRGSFTDAQGNKCYVFLEPDGVITYKNQSIKVFRNNNANTGQLEDGTLVNITCIKKGLMGVPNISTPDYRGSYTTKQGDNCFVFVQKSSAGQVSASS